MPLSITTLHPLFSEFPLPVLVMFAIFETRYLWRDKQFSQVLISRIVIISVLFSYLTGYLAKDQASITFAVPTSAIMIHQSLGLATLISTLLLSLSCELVEIFPQHRFLRQAMRCLLIVCLISTILANHFGGALVFDFGAGVRATISRL
ncbi:MAG: hypothetical protein PHC51_01710 [bacterium]|nr:hypothetical protein [bacterium]